MNLDPLFIAGAMLGLLLACVAHEWAHAQAAYSLGDPTSKYDGRLTLNPMVHLDPVGSIVLLITGITSYGAMPMGWAKPVRYDQDNFKDPFLDAALVAAAGPSINFIMAIMLAALFRLGLPAPIFWAMLVKMSVGFGLFNLFPLPPLDGWKILQAMLPKSAARSMRDFERTLGNYAAPLLLVFSFFFMGPFLRPIFGTIVGLLLGTP